MAQRRQPNIGKRPSGGTMRRSKVFSVMKDRALRQIKRGMVAEGLILGADRPPRYQFNWEYGDLTGTVYADDRSKARSLIKKNLGISAKQRLPVTIEITRYDNPQYLQAVKQAHDNLQAIA